MQCAKQVIYRNKDRTRTEPIQKPKPKKHWPKNHCPHRMNVLCLGHKRWYSAKSNFRVMLSCDWSPSV